jgi:uncharacterized membrane protein YkvA (DUF1232 family)
MPPCIPPECEPFDHQGFWHKLWAFAKRAGRPLIETCLLLYYTSQKDDLPLWAKLLIYSALAYFISPIDAIPDVLPMGLTDDIAVLSAALASITAFIDEQIRAGFVLVLLGHALYRQGDALLGGVHIQHLDPHNVADLEHLARVLDKFIADL